MPWPERTLWITWHEHRRTRSLVEALGGMHVRVFDDHRPLQRNLIGPVWTLGVLLRERPGLVFLHFSYLLMLVCVLYKLVVRHRRVTLICDCHNKALKKEADGVRARPLAAFKRFLLGHADLLVVTNETLLSYAARLNDSVAVLRDPLTDWQGEDEACRAESARSGEGPYVFFVCSFDTDEPVDLMFQAARGIVDSLDLDVVISGNPNRTRVPHEVRENPRIRLPGFMPFVEYRRVLSRAEVVVVLTEDTDCLVCGAYESVGASRGTVLSDTDTLRECFGTCAVYTEHRTDSLIAAVAAARLMTHDESGLSAGKDRFETVFANELTQFELQVRALLSGGSSG